MDGKDLKRRLASLLDEDSDSGWLDERSTYDFLFEAALDFVDRTGCLRSSQTITTVAEQAEYDLNPDFLRLYVKNDSNNLFIKYYDTATYTYPTWKDYEDVVYDNNTDSTSVPGNFTIIDTDLPDIVTGSATAEGTASGGKCTLAGAGFDNVEAGATVHNTTDGSDGVVVSKTSSSSLETALFGGTNAYWESADTYVIQPNPRYQLILDPLPSTAGHTITVPYVQRPAPVYHDYGTYRFVNPSVLVKYAFFMYKYRDREPNFGDAMYKFWDMEVRKKMFSVNKGQRPGKMKVNLKARR